MRCACGCEWFVVERVIRPLGHHDPAWEPVAQSTIWRLRCVDCGGYDGALGDNPRRRRNTRRRDRGAATSTPAPPPEGA